MGGKTVDGAGASGGRLDPFERRQCQSARYQLDAIATDESQIAWLTAILVHDCIQVKLSFTSQVGVGEWAQ